MEAAPMSLAGMFSGSTPHALVSTPNPVLDYELRRLRRPSTPQSLKHFSRVTLIIATAVVVIICLGAYTAYRLGGGVNTYPSIDVRPLQTSFQFVSIVSMLS